MLTSFRVQNFRGLSDLTIEPLDRVNLITGKNNTGKTALLEALYLLSQTNNPRSVIEVNEFRGIPSSSNSFKTLEETCRWLFPMKQASEPIKLICYDEQRKERFVFLSLIDPTKPNRDHGIGIRLVSQTLPESQMGTFLSSNFAVVVRYGESGLSPAPESIGFLDSSQSSFIPVQAITPWHPPVRYLGFGRTIIDKEIDLFSELDASNRQDEILDPLKILEPSLSRLSLLMFNGKPMIHGDIDLKRLMPITFMGEGFRRLLAIVLAIVNTRGGIVLIDEIDTGLHHSILPKVFEAIGQAARASDVQVFATTHSYECIMAAHRAFDEHEPYDLRLHRLERINGRVQAVTYDREMLETSEELMLEVR